MKVLVTGGSGFLGSHIAEQLVNQGHTVRALVRKSSNRTFLKSLARVEFADGDVVDGPSVDAAMAGVDAVVHSAALVKARTPDDFFAVNEHGTRTVLSAAKRIAPKINRLVLVSSLEAVGPSPDGKPLTENQAPAPVTHYGRSKLAAERAAIGMQDELPITIIRPTAIYGPRDVEIFAAFQSVARGVLPMIGDGRNTMSMIYAPDAAAACVKAITTDVPSGRVYFVDDGVIYVWRDALVDVERAFGRKAWFRMGVPFPVLQAVAIGTEIMGKLTGRAVMLNRDKVNMLRKPHWVCSSEAIRRDFEWAPTVLWAEGVRRTVAWYRDNKWL